MRYIQVSIAKPGQGQVNEDATVAVERMVAVSDGAGGGGIYAEDWSRYLMGKLPKDTPLRSFKELDDWIGSIWEPFYEEHEERAKKDGGMALEKFYDEGSFATLAAIWADGLKARWIAYGDSVAFCYNPRTQLLKHSFTSLPDFNKPPYLLNFTGPLREEGCKCGDFDIEDGCQLFCASDALSHYILMMYEIGHGEEFAGETSSALAAGTKFSNQIRAAMSLRKRDFYWDVLKKLINCGNNRRNFEKHINRLLGNGLISLDDYSFVCMSVDRIR